MQALGFIMAGVAAVAGIYFTWRNLQQGKDEQITERFTRAIDQLDSEKLEIRLGGIYALERIANDSPERDYSTIMEVLTAYLRENAPLPREAEPRPDSEASKDTGASAENEKQETKPPTDIQAILTVLGRRKKAGKKDDVLLDLSAADLRGANLSGANLHEALLWGANLQEAVLAGANLQGANLLDANLQEANLWEANLQGAHLLDANLQEANLLGANLQGAHLLDANLQEAVLMGANLEGAELMGVRLQGAHLSDANLQEANLRRANLQGAHLLDTNLQGAVLAGANLQGAKLWEANLRNTVYLNQDQINEADGNVFTRLPAHLQRPASWTPSDEEEKLEEG
jgi:uncharacterized protein YjbI with pentapeptide repeats